MIELLVGFHAQTHRITYGDNREMAQAELDRLLPLMGRDKWGSNGKAESPTHTMKTPTGDFVVVLEKVEMARLVDVEAIRAAFADQEAITNETAIRQELERCRALASEGFLKKEARNQSNAAE